MQVGKLSLTRLCVALDPAGVHCGVVIRAPLDRGDLLVTQLKVENRMERKTLDGLLISVGLVLAAVLLVAGGLLTRAGSFVHNEVNTQLSEQKIFFPPAGPATADPKIGPFLNQYAGQQLTTGTQAKAHADHFIAVHVAKATGGNSYAEISSAQKAAPDDPKLVALKQTAFQGETLRGLLLNAYAFGTMGTIATIAGIVSFIGAVGLLVLALLGFSHRRKLEA